MTRSPGMRFRNGPSILSERPAHRSAPVARRLARARPGESSPVVACASATPSNWRRPVTEVIAATAARLASAPAFSIAMPCGKPDEPYIRLEPCIKETSMAKKDLPPELRSTPGARLPTPSGCERRRPRTRAGPRSSAARRVRTPFATVTGRGKAGRSTSDRSGRAVRKPLRLRPRRPNVSRRGSVPAQLLRSERC